MSSCVNDVKVHYPVNKHLSSRPKRRMDDASEPLVIKRIEKVVD